MGNGRLIIIGLLSACLASFGAKAAEAVKLVTDKNVYVAGDLVWCSVFSLENGELSKKSAVAYVEVVSTSGVAATAKIAMVSGRGAGALVLPATIPTGNYKIFAYTAACEAAEASDIAVFNTMSSARVKGGVTIIDDPMPEVSDSRNAVGGIELSTEEAGGMMRITVRNKNTAPALLALSVCEDDGLRAAVSGNATLKLKVSEPESDGEIVRAVVYGKDATKVIHRPWLTAVISSPGSAADTYTGKIDADGIISFKTNNIYGDRDLVCEILGAEDDKLDCHFTPLSPFVQPSGLDIPVLRLSPSMKDALLARHKALKSPAKADTLFNYLPKRDNLLLSSEDCVEYHLDDYTRFNTIEDILLELVPGVRVQKSHGRRVIKMSLSDVQAKRRSDNVLVMLDGVPVSTHERLLSYDALALSDVQVYPYVYALGNTVFSGVVNFITSRHDMSALQFDDNVRILDFKGCSYPVELVTADKAEGAPAGRTLLWKPLLSLEAGAETVFVVPATGARMKVNADGVICF